MKLLHVIKTSGKHAGKMRVTGNKLTFWPPDNGSPATVRVQHVEPTGESQWYKEQVSIVD